MRVKALSISASVLALAWCGVAAAQTSVAEPPPVREAPPSTGQVPSAPQPGAGAPTATQVEEVVVTAERRPTNLQTTAIAATVLTGADLVKQGVTTVDQLQFVTPSLTIENNGQGNFFNIRGIGKSANNTNTTVGVITYRDGIATFPGFFQDEPYYDLASVEVLRGPQGTFVGQNATGGAVLITEHDPLLNGGYHGYVQAQAGNYGDVGAQGAINIPVSDTFAARLAFNDEYRNSFYHITGDYTGSPGRLREQSLRLSLLWQPNDVLRAEFKTDYNYIDQGGYPADPATLNEDPFHITSNAHWLAIDQSVRSVLNVSYLLPDGITLRSISGFQTGRTAMDGDLDGTDLAGYTLKNGVDETIFSQEINILSPSKGWFTWVAGAYYQHDKYTYPAGSFDFGLPHGVLDEYITGVNPNETTAGFGQVTFNLPHGFQIQGGLRYSASSSTNTATISILQAGVAIPDDQTESSSRLTGKVSLNWTFDSRNFLYAFLATGYKSGGVNTPTSFVVPPTFGPETVTDYEIGWKSTLFDGHLRTQIGGYYNDYNNFQVSIGAPQNPSASLELNDPSTTKIYGVEGQAQAVFGSFSLDAGLSFLHSKLGTFYAVDSRYPSTVPCNTVSGPGSASCVDLSGREQTYAPNFTGNVGGQYVFVLPNEDKLTPRLDYSHIAGQWATLFDNAVLGDRLAARDLLHAQVAYEHGSYLLTLYGSNLTNQEYVSSLNGTLRYEGAPRQVGVRVTRSF